MILEKNAGVKQTFAWSEENKDKTRIFTENAEKTGISAEGSIAFEILECYT